MHSFALAQSTADADFCAGSAGTGDDRIAACTREITSGTLSTANLAITFNSRGNAWRAKGDNDRAITDFNEAIRLNPRDAVAFDNRGNAWSDKRDNDRAIADYSEAIRLNPQEALTFIGRGNAWNDKGDNDRAIAIAKANVGCLPRTLDIGGDIRVENLSFERPGPASLRALAVFGCGDRI
jgi:tetratricopeptide (TPR) repeat protein